jgi:hypothetical protein
MASRNRSRFAAEPVGRDSPFAQGANAGLRPCKLLRRFGPTRRRPEHARDRRQGGRADRGAAGSVLSRSAPLSKPHPPGVALAQGRPVLDRLCIAARRPCHAGGLSRGRRHPWPTLAASGRRDRLVRSRRRQGRGRRTPPPTTTAAIRASRPTPPPQPAHRPSGRKRMKQSKQLQPQSTQMNANGAGAPTAAIDPKRTFGGPMGALPPIDAKDSATVPVICSGNLAPIR